MYYILTFLHSLLNAYPFGMKLAVMGTLAFSWIIARTSVEYAETLKCPNAGGIIVAGLCAPLTVLFGLSIIADSMWFGSYAQARLVAGLLLAVVVAAGICQRLALHTASQILLADGYDRGAIPILPKQRGS
jgi:hypothetical protein